MTLYTNSNEFLLKLVPILKILEDGHSDIIINSSNGQQQVEIKVKENIKLSSDLINNISKISGINYISFS